MSPRSGWRVLLSAVVRRCVPTVGRMKCGSFPASLVDGADCEQIIPCCAAITWDPIE